jgi:threonine/homoserine efflux transporter RhtA
MKEGGHRRNQRTMVYIDVRDRKFQLIVIAPIVLAVIFALLVLIDSPESIDVVGVLLGVVAALAFVVYIVVTFVLERVRESQASESE